MFGEHKNPDGVGIKFSRLKRLLIQPIEKGHTSGENFWKIRFPCIRFSNDAKKQAKKQGQNCNRNAKHCQTPPRYAKVKMGIGIMFLFAEKKN